MTTAMSQRYPINSWVKRLAIGPWFWAVLCLFFFAYPLIKSINRPLPPPRPILYKLPSYQLVNQYGKPFGSRDLVGKFYIANFFFSSCPTVCPKLMEKMQTIQHRVRGMVGHVALLSFTVDPEVDRPKKLFKVSRKYHANPSVWYFLTGSQEQLKDLINNGFKLAVGDSQDVGGSLYDIAHSQKFVLVDREGNIRGFYSSDKQGINQLMIDLGLLANLETRKEATTRLLNKNRTESKVTASHLDEVGRNPRGATEAYSRYVEGCDEADDCRDRQMGKQLQRRGNG